MLGDALGLLCLPEKQHIPGKERVRASGSQNLLEPEAQKREMGEAESDL